jgi:L-ascorbate metabolism protein UlaG (beta-lactamase superfamily)
MQDALFIQYNLGASMKNLFYPRIPILLVTIFALFIINGQNIAGSNSAALKFLGNAFLKINTTGGKVIYIDPYAVNQADSADIVLITHEHECHNDLSRIIQKSTCRVIRAANALLNGVYQSFTIGNIKITAVPAYNQYHLKSDGVGYLVEFDGIKIYHAGGTAKISEMADLTSQKIDYAFYPMTPGPEFLTQAAAVVLAKHDIPIHSNVSLTRVPDLTLIARFASPNKLVLDTDQTITLVHSSAGNVLKVPQSYSTIQSAIDTAQNGDTVLVSEGRYYENINYEGKGIVVTSKFYQTKNWQTVLNTIIDGSRYTNKDTASTVMFLSREDSTAVLDGFTITGGAGTKYLFPNGTGTNKFQEGGGIVMHYSSAVIKNNYIVNNVTVPQTSVTNGGGGGIASMYGNPKIFNNVVVSNNAGYAGGIVLNWSGGKVRNNIVYHNQAGAQYGCGGIMIWQGPQNSAWIENNTIVGNYSLKDGGGITISIASGALPIVKNNIVWGNRQVTGNQVVLPQYLSNNDVEDYQGGSNISVNPQFIDNTLLLADGSPCIDAGDVAAGYNDLADPTNTTKALTPSKGLLRNDLGAFGGQLAKLLPSLSITDLYTRTASINVSGKANVSMSAKIDILNLCSAKMTIDSVTAKNKSVFTIPSSYKGKSLNVFDKDTLIINCKPNTAGNLNDTIKVYYKANGVSGQLKIPFNSSITGVLENKSMIYEYKLFPCYPNPFNPSTQIRFSLAAKGQTILKIYDCLGRCVETLVNGEMESGMHNVTWNPKLGLASGIYLANLTVNSYSETKKLIFQK